MTITRRYSAEVAAMIEKIMHHPGAPKHALDVYLAALLINEHDDLPPRCHVHEIMAASTWMAQFGRLAWHRELGDTVVTWREHLN